jgi:hypothetical protein
MTDSDPARSAPPPAPTFQVRIPIEWDDPGEAPIVYANQVLISHAGPEFFLVFGVVVPPLNTNDLPDTLKIRPQVRVVVSREAMGSIVQAMNDNLQRFRDAQRRPPGSGGT